MIPSWYPVLDDRPWVAFLACRDVECDHVDHVKTARERYRKAMRAATVLDAATWLHVAVCDYWHEGKCFGGHHAARLATLPWFAELYRRNAK